MRSSRDVKSEMRSAELSLTEGRAWFVYQEWQGGRHAERAEGERADHRGGHLLAGRVGWTRQAWGVRVQGRGTGDRPPARRRRRPLRLSKERLDRIVRTRTDRLSPGLSGQAGLRRTPDRD